MGKAIDLTNRKFGRLTAIRLEEIRPRKSGGTIHFWLCQCECGNKTIVRSVQLLNGRTKSCGCLQREIAHNINKTHGLRNTKLYKKWLDIKKRCYNPNQRFYYCYGARGIGMCDEWRNDFKTLYDWAITNGYDEKAKIYECTIDRIDVNKDYSPENCRWVNQKIQNRNSRHCRLITYNNETHCLTEWAEITGLSANKIRRRLNRNWSIERALNTP